MRTKEVRANWWSGKRSAQKEDASIVGQQNAALAHIIKTWLWFIFRYWPDLSRGPPLLFFLLFFFFLLLLPQCLLGHSSQGCTAALVKPFFLSCSALCCEGDNGARQASARRARVPLPSMRFASAAPKWKSAFSPPLRSKWSLPSALLRMLKRHPSRNCTWDGGGCDWIWRRGWRGGEKTRNVHIIIITYLTVMQPHQQNNVIIIFLDAVARYKPRCLQIHCICC